MNLFRTAVRAGGKPGASTAYRGQSVSQSVHIRVTGDLGYWLAQASTARGQRHAGASMSHQQASPWCMLSQTLAAMQHKVAE